MGLDGKSECSWRRIGGIAGAVVLVCAGKLSLAGQQTAGGNSNPGAQSRVTVPQASRQAEVSVPQESKAQAPTARLRVTTEIVLVNVVVRDKKGNPVTGLKKEDFTVLEDGKKQDISSFDYENVDQMMTAGTAGATVSGTAAAGPALTPEKVQSLDARDRRLMLFFFDFSAMEPEEIDRAVDAAKKFVQTKIQPADLVAVVSLASNLSLDLDFTDDRAKIMAKLTAYGSSAGQGFENGGAGSAEGAAETGGSYTPDDTDYNTFSADRKLLALESVMQAIGRIPQKKSLIYFSNGISQSGVDNQSALRAATAAAVKADVSIYPVDVRGLQAFPPGGQAQSASLHGQSGYSGASVLNDLSSNAASQETLYTLASDTGGKAFMDSNDLSGVFSQVQKDSSVYYVIGYTSTNHLKDGHFRRLKVQVNRSDVKIDARAGYYADRDYAHMNRTDREEQLQDELASELPRTDVGVYAGTAYFRQDDSHYFLSVSLLVQGSQIPFVTEKDKDNATLDIIGEVLESGKLPVGRLRDSVKLVLDSGQQVRRKNIQYNTSFVLAPGTYHLKFIVRENRSGKMGSFETDVRVPDLRKAPLRMSSVVLSSQRVPSTQKKKAFQPLVSEQTELVPSVTHVFTQDQKLYLQYEVYDPAKSKAAEAGTSAGENASPKGSIRVLTNIEFLQGEAKVYETKPIVAREVTAADRRAVIFQVEIPLQGLAPGFYTCQINVIDDVGGTFSFPRWLILIKAALKEDAARKVSGMD
jgi:VWFA-related protein